MGSWAYCHCGAGLSQPTIREAVEGKQECHAGHVTKLSYPADALISILEDFEERLVALEERFKPPEE